MRLVGEAGLAGHVGQRASRVNLLARELQPAHEQVAVWTCSEHEPELPGEVIARQPGDHAARIAALESGASAFIHKSRAAQDVVDAIRTVAVGGSLFTPRTIAQLLNTRREVEAQLERLTPREKEVLRLMAEGTSSRDIASQLGISYTTVRTHIRSLGSKLGVHSKLEAIVKARELALVE